MLRIDKDEKKLVHLKKSALADADHWERQLQAMICAAPNSFCEEIGESLWVIGQEVRPSDNVPDRIDILAVDEGGNAVVIELKRGTNKLQLLQAVSYAGMVSRWPADRFIETLAANYSQSRDDARSEIEDHTGTDISKINHAQRILLIAEDYDPALLVAAEWLHENFGVDIRCYRLQLSQEDNGSDYLTCSCIYPPIEIATLTRRSEGRSGPAGTAWANWDAALEGVQNPAVKEFVRSELAKNREARLQYREVIYRMAGQRRFYLACRKQYAYVLQWGRFEGDQAYWQGKLSEPGHVQQVSGNRALRFHVTTAPDIAAFAKAMSDDLKNVEFSETGDLEPTPNGA
jgi:hypothetical protein